MLISKIASWNVPPASDNITQTIIQASVNSAPLTDVSAVNSSVNSTTVTLNAVPGDTLNYRAVHSNSSGNSLPTMTVSVVVPQPPVPSPPTGFTVV